MLILAAMVLTVAGLLSKLARQVLGPAFWVCLAVTLITLYGMTL